MSSAQSRDFVERIIPEVRTGGARNIVELAKALRMPVETTRYKVKGMLRRGLSVHASVDYNKFGLAHHYARFFLSQKTRENEKKFFQALSDSCYLTSFARKLPSNEYFCTFAVPHSRGASSSLIHRLLRSLTEERLIERSRISNVTWRRAHMIQPEFFNLKRGIWQVDWAKLRKESAPGAKAEEKESSPSEFDDLDLNIARELETNALARLSDIADSLKTTLNNIFYHFHKHITEAKLVDEFVIRWSGNQKHETMFMQFDFNSLGVAEERTARSALRRLPFLWFDAFSRDTGYYVGEAVVPSTHYLETLNFLSWALGDISHKLRVHVLDSRTRQQLPLPAHLFKDGNWEFDPESCLQQVNSRLKK